MATLSGSTHAIAHECMLMSNLGLSREEAHRRTEEYLAQLDAVSDQVQARRRERDLEPDDDPPPF
jgi:hypothetical protein